MWTKGNYRRNLMDMHIDDWNEEFLSKVDCKEYVDVLAQAGIQAAMVKAKPHTGLCYYPTKISRMHKGLKGKDFLGEMIQRCHEKDIAVIVYMTQIFDNWAYDNHPDWRCITPSGIGFREYRGPKMFTNGRYGIVCPNNPGYREYVKETLTEIAENYDYEGMFLDMTFFPDICYCPECRKRYFEETGRELPREINWEDEEFLEWQSIREKWLAEYACFATNCVKQIKPDVTIEHQFSRICSSWVDASTERLLEAVDYAGGDYYGGFLQQTFINRYYKNVSPTLPFVYHTSRCDPTLDFHTTTKTEEELLIHVITALIHNGAFLLVDAINPDGSIVPEVYSKLMKNIYSKTRKYEDLVTGDLIHDAAIWFSTFAKFDPNEKGVIHDRSDSTKYYLECPVKMASILRDNNIAFEVIGSKNLKDYKGKVLILSHVAKILDEEMEQIETYLLNGGNLYVSGCIAHKRLEQLLGVEKTGKTAHNFTYISPADCAVGYFEGFTQKAPLTINMHQYTVDIKEPDCEVLGTLTLPYTMTETPDFAAIHSNPPGVYTEHPSVIRRKVGKGQIIWTAAPIELMSPYMSRQTVANLIRDLIGKPAYESNAPKFVEVIGWKKEKKTYFAVINQQEASPVVPIHDIYIDLPKQGVKARLAQSDQELRVENLENGTRIYLPKLEVFHVIEIID